MRDPDHQRRLAVGHGPAIGAYASAVLDTPLPWTKMRQVLGGQVVGVGDPPARSLAGMDLTNRPR